MKSVSPHVSHHDAANTFRSNALPVHQPIAGESGAKADDCYFRQTLRGVLRDGATCEKRGHAGSSPGRGDTPLMNLPRSDIIR